MRPQWYERAYLAVLAGEEDPPKLIALRGDFRYVVDDHRPLGWLGVGLWQRHLGTDRGACAKGEAGSCRASEERKGEREHDGPRSVVVHINSETFLHILSSSFTMCARKMERPAALVVEVDVQ